MSDLLASLFIAFLLSILAAMIYFIAIGIRKGWREQKKIVMDEEAEEERRKKAAEQAALKIASWPVFSLDGHGCPKCACPHIKIRWHDNYYSYDIIFVEYMVMKCKRCKYLWHERIQN